jgi:hypothetical protein
LPAPSTLWIGDFQIATNLSRREIIDFAMARNARCFAIGRPPPNRVPTAFAKSFSAVLSKVTL